ncbi:MAG: ligase-associated DNA damage response exonuclease [Muricauda sp.]|nr:ligase-associated DNA damage response exonuclease [Allomuricauda sp.]MBO6533522.1 ligase-associated DNA damage response exonuclease [Allomuricauda sp.]MBO6588303.1 ligase-associated DNA damage response exonuclease [Allomuricauda sp.]MBO6617928.1 ligase-associated DNA damage response exonuclease [Allomuricauda sp.]MBO6643061.1 ligase-associated DNA damage response exonuclease [Allomuricauda sp.]MBO6746263.1 ligase-associated DNA damage response exonuclease [Allomuricauda sp.]
MKTPLLQFTPKGIYCEQADVYLDPWRPVDKAIISHGHADHSRWGHQKYITHHKNVPIVQHRLGDVNISGKDWGETFSLNNVKFSLHPAGHIVGSSQIRVEHKGEVWVFTGDYKIEDDGLTTPFELVKCHTFITECTFGLPAFQWRPQQEVFNDINQWWAQNKSEGKTSVLFGYSLGKAQRLLKHLDTSIGKIYTHGAVENVTEVLRPLVDLPPTHLITKDTKKDELLGNIVVAPPSAHGSTWIRKMVPYVTATASGWMAFRGARRRRAIDKGFVLSDHCDWNGLLQTVEATGAEKIICTHGYTDIFSKYLQELGYDARTEATQYEGELSEVNATEQEKLEVE